MDEQRAEFEAFVLQDTGVSLRGNVEAMTPGIGLAWRSWQAATQRQQERISALEAQVQALSVDAGRWRMLPAYFYEYQIDAMKLYRDIDTAIAAGKGEVNG